MMDEVVKHADNCIGPLPNIHSLVDDEIDLSGKCFTADPKQGSLAGRKEVDRSKLKGLQG